MQSAARDNLLNMDRSSIATGFGRPLYLLQGPSSARVLDKFLFEIRRADYLSNQTEPIIRLADFAYAHRRIDELEQLGKLLMEITPRGAGAYYLGLAAKIRGAKKNSLALLGVAADCESPKFRAKAFLTLGAISREENRLDESLYFRLQALRIASHHCFEPLVIVEAQRGIAILRSLAGDHQAAAVTIEKTIPLAFAIRQAHPTVYYDVLNSCAVELGEIGRINEALAMIGVALRSPFAGIYTEWEETRSELLDQARGASRSTVAIKQIEAQSRVLRGHFPASEPVPYSAPSRRDRVPSINRWRASSQPAKNQPAKEMDRHDKANLIVNLLYDATDEQLDAILEVLSDPATENVGHP